MSSSDTTLSEKNSDESVEDFASLFESGQYDRDTIVRRDTRVEGQIVGIGEEWVFVDIGAKTEGAIAREEMLDESGGLAVSIGDTISAYVISTRGGEVLLSKKMTSAASEDALKTAYRSGIPVEGLVTGERKGGYSVSVFGKQSFCPYSQMDLPPMGENSDYLDRRFLFRVTQYSEGGRNVVLSRRPILEEERAQKIATLKQSLQIGNVLEGCVRRTVPFGAFVDVGGIDGLIPISEIAWFRVSEVSDILKPGDNVRVKIVDLDWENMRISLSLKQAQEGPWESVVQRYPEEKITDGIVTKLMNFGAFVELEPGIEGLIHISNLGVGRRINHPREVISEGDLVQVRILSTDKESRKIGLERIVDSGSDISDPLTDLKEGDVLLGTIESVKDYGVFVGLPGGKSGLLHSSEISGAKGGSLRNRWSVGTQLEVQVLKIDERTGRIALSTKSMAQRNEDDYAREFASTTEGKSSFGKLGDLLRPKMK
jgi:small subunit ribosomal protein S1